MEEQEFEALVTQHYQSIYQYCCRHVGEQELAQDLTQTTFLRLWQGRARYVSQGKALNYLYTIAGNLCRDWFKSKKPLLLEDLKEEPAASPDSETALAVRAALEALPFAQRNVVILHYYHGFTAAEIAAITRSTVPAVRYRLHRAEKDLRERLKEEL